MTLIKFPSHIPPARVTVFLQRVDETFVSPLTNIQQVVSRGNPAWRWIYEFTDISDDERDIVHAFLMKCKGSINNFKITDPGDYEIKGSISNWIDIFSGYGDFLVTAGSTTSTVNSWFLKASILGHEAGEDGLVRFEWHRKFSVGNLRWRGEGTGGKVSSFDLGKAYVQRIKHFAHPIHLSHQFYLRVGSGNGPNNIIAGPAGSVKSSDSITVPFIVGADVNSYDLNNVDQLVSAGNIGDYWHYADYRLARCALVANSENLLSRSNEFDHADWTVTNATVDSGYADASPTGVTSGAWKFYVDTSVDTHHLLFQTVTKITTEDIYTTSITARESELSSLRISLDDGNVADGSRADFDLSAGTISNLTNAGVSIRAFAAIFDVGSDWFRCQMTGVVSSLNQIRSRCSVLSGTFHAFTGNGSDGIEIFGSQLVNFPFMKHYVPTVANTVVPGSGQTGSTLYVDGFDPEDIIKSGQRFEIVNQFHNGTTGLFERSEFKRTTQQIKVHREGWAILEFDPPIRNAPTTDRSNTVVSANHLGETMHNPVIFHQPEMKARLVAGTVQYVDKPLKVTDIIFDVIEDLSE